MKSLFILIGILLFCSVNHSVFGQSLLINYQVEELQILNSDSMVKLNGIAVKETMLDYKGYRKLKIEEVFYDNNGYIKEWTRFDTGKTNITISGKYVWNSDSSVLSTISINCPSLPLLKDRRHFAYEYLSFASDCKKNGGREKLLIQISYTLTKDTSLFVETKIADKIVDTSRNLYASPRFTANLPREKPFPGDTLIIGDSIVLVNNFTHEDFRKRTTKRYYLPSREDEVKFESWSFVGDSLVSYSAIEDSIDQVGRIFWHKRYYGVTKDLWESERTVYNDLDGSKTIERDVDKSDGTPEMIWKYDSRNRLVKYSKLFKTKNEIMDLVYTYNHLGLIISTEEFINGVSILKEIYEYKSR